MPLTTYGRAIDKLFAGGDYGDAASIGIDNKFDCFHCSDWYGVHRHPDSPRAFSEPGLSNDLGRDYQRNHYANRWLAYRVQNNQGAIKPICSPCDAYQATMRLRQLPTV